jgi:hypothetical protein
VGEIVLLEFRQKGETAYRCHARLAYRLGRPLRSLLSYR